MWEGDSEAGKNVASRVHLQAECLETTINSSWNAYKGPYHL